MPAPKPRRPRRKDDPAAAAPEVAEKPAADSKPPAAATPSTPPPEGLHPRGRALWTELGQRQGTAAGELALEACRMVDRLNELDRIIAGKGVMQLMQFRLDHIDWDNDQHRIVKVTVGFQEVLKEARLQQTALKDVLKELRAAIAAAQSITPPAPTGATPAAGSTAPALSPLDQLAARRAQREQATT